MFYHIAKDSVKAVRVESSITTETKPNISGAKISGKLETLYNERSSDLIFLVLGVRNVLI